ncbi:MAG: universal stress protein, partial [Cytophagaceae bacterium]
TKRRLIQLKEILEKKGFKTTIELREGLPYLELEAYTKNIDDAIIISGTSGKGFIKGMVLGSTVNHLIKHSKLPILIIRCIPVMEEENGFVPELACSNSNYSVLFPTDFSENSQHAFQLLLENVVSYAQKINLLHVQDKQVMKYRTDSDIEKFNETDKARLEELKQKILATSTLSVYTEVTSGNPTKVILDKIKENDCSLVVIGKHGRGFIEEFIVGSVTRKVLEESKTNFLIVPRP